MTFTIPRPSRSPEVDFDTARASRGRRNSNLLGLAKETVMEAYKAYGSANGLAPVDPLDADDETRHALRTNYPLTYGNGALSDLRDELMASSRLSKCPMCDKGDVASLDHYLPKEVYPEFSVLALNLVPACSTCNLNKRSIVGTDATGRFIHAYLDALPHDVPLYCADVVIEEAVAAVYSVNSTLPPALYKNAVFQFEMLNLGELYGVGAAQELWDYLPVFVEAHGDGGEPSVRHQAELKAKRTRRQWGIHSWRAALYDALAKSESFCEGGFMHIEDLPT
jgi:hypothetical protein